MRKIINQIIKIKKIEYYLISIIIVFAFLVRLYKIDSPIADWHSFRQADTASVTRVYVEEGINLLQPRYHDLSSTQSRIFNPQGYRFVEFPLFNGLHAVLTKSFPVYSLEVWGRLLSVFSSLVSTYLLFLIGRRFIDKWGGILSAFFFAFLPFNIYFSRVILPEPLAVTFGLSVIWLFVKSFDEDKQSFLYLSGVVLTLGMLIKPFIIFFATPLVYLVIRKYGTEGLFKKPKQLIKFLLFLDITLIPFFAWRIWINQYPAGIPEWTWMFNGDRIRFRPSFWRWIFGERLGRLILGIWGLIPFSFGLLKVKRENFFNLFFLLGMFLYVLVFATANVRHDYYQTIAIPAISLLLAQGSLSMWRAKEFNLILSRSLLIFSLFMMFSISAFQVREFYKINRPEIIEAGQAVDEITPRDALVIAPYNGDTAFLYQTKRRGWPVVDTDFDTLIKRGANYYVSVTKNDPDTLRLRKEYKVIKETASYIIIDLGKAEKK